MSLKNMALQAMTGALVLTQGKKQAKRARKAEKLRRAGVLRRAFLRDGKLHYQPSVLLIRAVARDPTGSFFSDPEWLQNFRRAFSRVIVRCPKCGEPATQVKQEVRPTIYYTCCGLYSFGTGRLLDPETARARALAHAAFDPIWQNGLMGRNQAYDWLAQQLSCYPWQAHMSTMDYERATEAKIVCARHLKEVNVWLFPWDADTFKEML